MADSIPVRIKCSESCLHCRQVWLPIKTLYGKSLYCLCYRVGDTWYEISTVPRGMLGACASIRVLGWCRQHCTCSPTRFCWGNRSYPPAQGDTDLEMRSCRLSRALRCKGER